MKNLKKVGIVALVLSIAYGGYKLWEYCKMKAREEIEEEKFWKMDELNLGDAVVSKCREGNKKGEEVEGYLYRKSAYTLWIGDKNKPTEVYTCDWETTKKKEVKDLLDRYGIV